MKAINSYNTMFADKEIAHSESASYKIKFSVIIVIGLRLLQNQLE